ncbi:AI-2E family transporter [bacterium]|nr:MAG: AI-2E family transporter [bacterium]
MAENHQKLVISVATSTLFKIVAVALILLALYVVRDLVLTLIISVILASAMDPLVDWLFRKARFPRGLSVILVYLFFVALITMVFYFIIPPMVSQFSQLGEKFIDFRNQIQTHSGNLADIFNQLGITKGLSGLGQSITNLTSNLFQTTIGFVSGLVQVVAVLAITFYLISSESGMKNLIKSLVPFKHQAYAMRLTDKIQTKMGYWLLGQLVLSGFIFLLDYIGLSILGVKYALALALLAGLLEVVPYLGPILSAVPGVFVAFVQSPPLAVIVIILYIVVQQLENYILVPKVMGRTVGSNPVIILLAVLVGFKIAGILGMLIAVPIVAAVQVFIDDVRGAKDEMIA